MSEQLSDATGVNSLYTEQTVSVPIVMLGGQVTKGATSSLTVTLCKQVLEFPEVSVTVYKKYVSPIGNVAPLLLTDQVIPSVEQLSAKSEGADGKYSPTQLLFASIVTSSGQVKVGAVTSTTVTSTVQCALLPAASVAVNTTNVVPRPNCCVVGTEPDPPITPFNAQLTVAPQLSVSNALSSSPSTPAQVAPASSVTSFGQVITGLSSSTTVTDIEQVAALLDASVIVNVTIVWPTAKLPPKLVVGSTAGSPGVPAS